MLNPLLAVSFQKTDPPVYFKRLPAHRHGEGGAIRIRITGRRVWRLETLETGAERELARDFIKKRLANRTTELPVIETEVGHIAYKRAMLTGGVY